MIRPGVRCLGIKPEIVLAIDEVRQAMYEMDSEELQISSIVEGRHRRESIHYSGGAFDIALRHIIEGYPSREGADKWLDQVLEKIRRALGYPDSDYDVVDERNSSGGPHFHVEYQPKRPY